MTDMTPDEEQLKKELEAIRGELDKEREDHKKNIESVIQAHEGRLERERDAFSRALQHIKLRLMTRAYESMQDILKMESAINDPKSLFGKDNNEL